MELARDERKERTLKIYLTKHCMVNANLNYNIGGVIIPKEFIDFVTGGNEGLPIVYFKSGVKISGETVTTLPNNIECVGLWKDDIRSSLWLPVKLFRKIKIEERTYITLTSKDSHTKSSV